MMKATPATARDLRATARDILIGNDRGTFTAPGPHQYPGQWNWDSALIAIGLARIDPGRARHEVIQLLQGQWEDGMVPHIVFWNGEGDYFPGPAIWSTDALAAAPIPVSGVTQPPVLATAVRLLYERDPDRAFLERVVPAVEQWHRWLDRERRREGSLVTILHPWESGTDNSPRFDAPLRQVPAGHQTPLERRDTRHVPEEQRPTTGQYHRYLSILESLRKSGYRPSPEQAEFAYGDIGFTSILAAAEEDLIHLWRELGENGGEARRRHKALGGAVATAWDHRTPSFLDRDARTGQVVNESVDCSTSLLPLYAGLADAHQADSMLGALWDGSRFGPGAEYPWAVTSVAKSSPAFDPLRYWRGPVWINMNWFMIRGLQRSGLDDHAERLRQHTLELVARNGMFEYYSPRTGRGLGSSDFSWTAALTLDLVDRP